MKKLPFFFFLFTAIAGFSQAKKLAIIPEPVSVTEKSGTFTLKNNFTVSVSGSDADALRVANQLSQALTAPTGFKGSVKQSSSSGTIQLKLAGTADDALGNEGYKLTVSSGGVIITANKPAGLFYGVQTFLQLLPKDIESKKAVAGTSWTAPAVEIMDKPRFGWRGLMFDVSRHFFTKAEVKQFIDDMVKYKFNLLHWHLTDDEG